jgi:hypothetical protein
MVARGLDYRRVQRFVLQFVGLTDVYAQQCRFAVLSH